ncbi:uncharacterized protein [Paramormyrops kingsleyae]|uniref:uncharacterized protein isoform X1 n=2 Tax=Paramormyrops kingsleyae TaxID=1676925 RepID=UPI000CD628F0|nr:MANSC domain-containing protein 4 isoform X1 [Paramormyrops kingsleyae]
MPFTLNLFMILNLVWSSETKCSPTTFYKNCWIRRFPGIFIDIDESQRRGAQLLKFYQEETALKCSRTCCLTRNFSCNLAMFHYDTVQESVNCFHLHCPTLESCIPRHRGNVILYNISAGVDPDLLVFGKYFPSNVRVWPHLSSRPNSSDLLASDKRQFNRPAVSPVQKQTTLSPKGGLTSPKNSNKVISGSSFVTFPSSPVMTTSTSPEQALRSSSTHSTLSTMIASTSVTPVNSTPLPITTSSTFMNSILPPVTTSTSSIMSTISPIPSSTSTQPLAMTNSTLFNSTSPLNTSKPTIFHSTPPSSINIYSSVNSTAPPVTNKPSSFKSNSPPVITEPSLLNSTALPVMTNSNSFTSTPPALTARPTLLNSTALPIITNPISFNSTPSPVITSPTSTKSIPLSMKTKPTPIKSISSTVTTGLSSINSTHSPAKVRPITATPAPQVIMVKSTFSPSKAPAIMIHSSYTKDTPLHSTIGPITSITPPTVVITPTIKTPSSTLASIAHATPPSSLMSKSSSALTSPISSHMTRSTPVTSTSPLKMTIDVQTTILALYTNSTGGNHTTHSQSSAIPRYPGPLLLPTSTHAHSIPAGPANIDSGKQYPNDTKGYVSRNHTEVEVGSGKPNTVTPTWHIAVKALLVPIVVVSAVLLTCCCTTLMAINWRGKRKGHYRTSWGKKKGSMQLVKYVIIRERF